MAKNAYKLKSVFPLSQIAESPGGRLTLGGLRSAAAAKNMKSKRAVPLDYDETEVDEDIENVDDYDNFEDDDNGNDGDHFDDDDDVDDDENDGVRPATGLSRGLTSQKRPPSRAEAAAVGTKRSAKGTAAMPANKVTKKSTRTSSTAAAAAARKVVPATPATTARPASKAAAVAEPAAAGAKRQRKVTQPRQQQQQQQQRRKQQEQEQQQQQQQHWLEDSDNDEDMDDQHADEDDSGGVRARAENAPTFTSVEDSTLGGQASAAPQDDADLSEAVAAGAVADEDAAPRPKKRSRSVKTAKASAPEPAKRLKSEAAGAKALAGRRRLASQQQQQPPPSEEKDDEEEMVEEEEEAMADERPRMEVEQRGRKGSRAKSKAAEAVRPKRGAKQAAATRKGPTSVDESNIIERHEQRLLQPIHETQTSQLDMYDTLGAGAGAEDAEMADEEEHEQLVDEGDEPTLRPAGRARYGSRAPSESRQLAPPVPRTTTMTRTRAVSQPMAAPELALVPAKVRGRRGGGRGAAEEESEDFALAGGNAGLNGNAPQSDPMLRRQLGEATRRYEELQRRHQRLLQNLRQVGIEEAEANLERIKKQINEKNQAAENLVASLRTEAAGHASLAKKTRASLDAAHTKLDATQAKLDAAQTKLDAAQTALAARASDADALQTKVAQLTLALEAAEASGKAQAKAAEASSRAQAKAAEATNSKAQAKLAQLTSRLTAAEADNDALRTKLAAANAEAEAARKAAAAAAAAPPPPAPVPTAQAAAPSSALTLAAAAAGGAAAEPQVPGSALKKMYGNGGGRGAAAGAVAAVGRGVIASGALSSAEAASRIAELAQQKETLYSDLTGLILTNNLKRTVDATIFDCVQTGINGTLHFRLTIPHPVPSLSASHTHHNRKRSRRHPERSGSHDTDTNYNNNNNNNDDADADPDACTFTPLLHPQRDRDLLDILPGALAEEIKFPREQIDLLYRRVFDALRRPPRPLPPQSPSSLEEPSEYTAYTATTTPGPGPGPDRAAVPTITTTATTAAAATTTPHQQQRQKGHGQVKHEGQGQGQGQGQQGGEGAPPPPSGANDADDADEGGSYMDDETTHSQLITSPELRLGNF